MFMVKTQGGDLVQISDFVKSSGETRIKLLDKTDPNKCWGQDYKTEQRRDEVMAELETWIRTMTAYRLFGYEILLPLYGDEIHEQMIFTFPQE